MVEVMYDIWRIEFAMASLFCGCSHNRLSHFFDSSLYCLHWIESRLLRRSSCEILGYIIVVIWHSILYHAFAKFSFS